MGSDALETSASLVVVRQCFLEIEDWMPEAKPSQFTEAINTHSA